MSRREVQMVSLKLAMTTGLLTLGSTNMDAQENKCFIQGECPGIAGCVGTPEWVGNCAVYCWDPYPSHAVCSGG
jgi:hypothetical protein